MTFHFLGFFHRTVFNLFFCCVTVKTIYIEYKMYLKILQKLRGLVAFQNRPSAPIGRDENFVNFVFLEGRFCKEKPSIFH